MAVEGKSNGSKRRFNPIGTLGRTSRNLRFVLQVIAIIFISLFAALCLFGYINQVQTGQSMVEYFLQIGGEIGDGLTLIFTGDDSAPIDITDQGVYIDGYAPDGADNLMDNGGQEQKSASSGESSQ